jgi:hypothetical protein
VAGTALPEEKDGRRVKEMEPSEESATEEGGLEWTSLEIFFDVEQSKAVVDEIADMPCLQRFKAGSGEKILGMGNTGDTGKEVKNMKGRYSV